MKKIISLLVAGVVILSSCKKETGDLKALSSYSFINATTDVASIKGYAADHEIPWRTLPATDAAAQYKNANLSSSPNFGAWAGPNIIRSVNAADTTKVIFNSSKAEDFEQGKMNNIFLCGNATDGYGVVFLKNESPVNYADEVFGVRFINLSPNSSPLNITLSTSTGTNEASNLGYKQITNFKTYPALTTSPAMTFQVRDAANTLLASYVLPVSGSGSYALAGILNAKYKSMTLVIKGLQGTSSGTNALGIFPVPHY